MSVVVPETKPYHWLKTPRVFLFQLRAWHSNFPHGDLLLRTNDALCTAARAAITRISSSRIEVSVYHTSFYWTVNTNIASYFLVLFRIWWRRLNQWLLYTLWVHSWGTTPPRSRLYGERIHHTSVTALYITYLGTIYFRVWECAVLVTVLWVSSAIWREEGGEVNNIKYHYYRCLDR